MGAEIDAVTRRQHADTVVDNGFRWVGAGRHGANNPERRVLKQHHPAIAGEGAGSEILYARRVFKSGFIFQIFIFFVAHAGFRGALFRQRRQLGASVSRRALIMALRVLADTADSGEKPDERRRWRSRHRRKCPALAEGQGRRRELFTEDGADKGFQFCCIH